MNSELQLAQERVESVMERINEEIIRLDEETYRRKNEVVHIRKHFWDEIKVNSDTFDDFLETIIVVDEAQDYSSFQFEFLKRLFPAARMTVLGDFNQAIFAHGNEIQKGTMESWDTSFALLSV